MSERGATAGGASTAVTEPRIGGVVRPGAQDVKLMIGNRQLLGQCEAAVLRPMTEGRIAQGSVQPRLQEEPVHRQATYTQPLQAQPAALKLIFGQGRVESAGCTKELPKGP